MAAKLKDIANATGYSMSTVSRVMRGDRYTDKRTKKAILAAAKKLQYRPIVAARRLRYGRSFVLGMVVQDVTNPFFSHAILGAERYLRQRSDNKLELLVANTAAETQRETSAINLLLQRQVEGLVVASNQTTETLALIRAVNGKDGIPIVSVDNDLGGSRIDVVGVDGHKGALALTRHLIARGYRRIGIVAGPQIESHARARLAGFRAALKDARLNVDQRHVVEGDWSMESGQIAVTNWIASGQLPDAILACNNFMGMGVLAGMKAAGMKVPDHMGLVTFDDVEFGDLFQPGITTLKYSWEEIGAKAVELLIERLETAGKTLPARRIEIPFELLVRGSCGSAKPA